MRVAIVVKPLFGWPLALVCALLGGLALWSAFPPLGWGYSAPIGVALITAAAYRSTIRRGLVVGLLAGWAAYLPMLAWLQVVGPDAWILLSTLCACWIGLVGVGTALVTRLSIWPLWVVAVAALWVLSEGLRSRIPWGGFAWGRLAFAQADTIFGPPAWVLGMVGVSAIVALFGAVIVALGVGLRERRRHTRLAAALVITVGIFGLFIMRVVSTPSSPASTTTTSNTTNATNTATIAIVQGGTPQLGMGAMDVRRAVLDNHALQSLKLGRAIEQGAVTQPDFVLWPENSSDIDPYLDAQAAEAIMRSAQLVRAPILVGAVLEVPEDSTLIRNAGIVWDPVTGPGERYIKRHLVPFGEFVPYRTVIAQFIDRLDRVYRDFQPGELPGNLTVAGVPLGLVICFEVANDDVVRDVVVGGAEVLAVQTNNATFGGTAQPDQQLQIERMRALETSRFVLVAATSGISAVIDTSGAVTQRLNESQTGFLLAPVPLRVNVVPAMVIGGWLELVFGLFAVGALVAALRSSSRRDRDQAGAADQTRTVG